jgi:hypothetical protein
MTADTEALIPMAELSDRWAVTPNTVSRRLAFLGIKPIRQGNFRFITADQAQQAQDLHEHILSGKPQDTFPGLPTGQVTRQVKSNSQVVRQVPSPEDTAALVSVIASVMGQQPVASSDPLKRAKGLADAADHALVLTTDELTALGVKGIDGFADGDEAFGYRFGKHRQRNRTLWTVERSIAVKAA